MYNSTVSRGYKYVYYIYYNLIIGRTKKICLYRGFYPDNNHSKRGIMQILICNKYVLCNISMKSFCSSCITHVFTCKVFFPLSVKRDQGFPFCKAEEKSYSTCLCVCVCVKVMFYFLVFIRRCKAKKKAPQKTDSEAMTPIITNFFVPLVVG